MKKNWILFLSFILLAPIALHASEKNSTKTSPSARENGVYAGLSTMGLNFGYQHQVHSQFAFRVGGNFLGYDLSDTEAGFKYKGRINFRSIEVIGNHYPFANNGFFLSGGFFLNQNKIEIEGENTTSITLDGTTFTGQNIKANYSAALNKNPLAPYIGIGYSSTPEDQGWGFTANLGVLYQTPKRGTLTISGVNDPTGTLNSKRAQVERDLNQNLKRLNFYPVVQVGALYHF